MEMIIRQLQYFSASFLCGVLLMWAYDFIILFRMKIRHSRMGRLLEDWVFWFVAAVVVFQWIFDLNYGVMRSFFVVSFTTGLFVYRKVVGNRFVHAVSVIFHQIFRPYVWIRKKIRKREKKTLK
jgi:hypothetical protein